MRLLFAILAILVVILLFVHLLTSSPRDPGAIQSDLVSALTDKSNAVKAIEALNGNASSKDADFNAANTKLVAANKKIAALEQEMMRAAQSLTAQLRAAQTASTANDAKIAAIQAQIAGAGASSGTNSGAATVTQQKIESLQNKTQNLQDNIAALNAQLATLNTQKATLQAQIKAIQDKSNGIAFDFVDPADYNTLKLQLNTATDRSAVLQSQLTSSQSGAADLQKQLDSANAQISDLKGQISDMQAASLVAQQQIQSLQTQVNAATADQAKIADLQSQVAALQAKMTAANQAQTAAQLQISDLQSQVATATLTITDLRAQNAKLQSRINKVVAIAGVLPKDYTLLQANNTMNCLNYDGTTLSLQPCAAVAAQLWHYDRVDGYVYNRNGQVLEALTSGNGIKVTSLSSGSSAQMWTPVNNAFLQNDSTGKYLGVDSTSGAIVQMDGSGNGGGTGFTFTNKLDGVTPIIVPAIEIGGPITCPSDMDLKGGLCYSKCPLGWSSDGGLVCYKDCPDNWDGTTDIPQCLKKRTYSAAKLPSACPATAPNSYGGLCYQSCPAGSSNDFGQITSCRANCPSGTQQGPNTCYSPPDVTSRATTRSGSQPLVSGCPSGTWTQWGGCYPGCPSGYSMTSAGRCTQNCPSNYRDDGTSCWLDTYWYDANIINNFTPVAACPIGYFRPSPGEWRCVQCPNGGTFDGSRCRVDATNFTKDVQWVTAQALTSSCPSSAPNKIGALCYPNCPAGTTRETGNLEFCSTNCPSGYTTNTFTCNKNPIITNRNVVKSLPAGVPQTCAAGQTQKGALCYDSCPAGSERRDVDIEFCDSVCPDGFVDLGAGCQKPSQTLVTKSVVEVGVCPDGQENRGGLCYIP